MVEIRKAGITDIYEIYSCNKNVLPIYYSLDEYLLFTFSTNTILLVAYEGNNLCGYLVAQYTEPTIHIMSFGVYQKHRRKGIGSDLIKKLEGIVFNEWSDIDKISLYVHAGNKGGISFYGKNGFERVKIMKNYYRGSLKNADTQDAYRLEKKINK